MYGVTTKSAPELNDRFVESLPPLVDRGERGLLKTTIMPNLILDYSCFTIVLNYVKL